MPIYANTFIGIDPGSISGAVACILQYPNRTEYRSFRIKDYTIQEIRDNIKAIMLLSDTMAVCIEKVHSMPGQGVTSTGKFMENFGILQGICIGLNIKYDLITPQTWMKSFNMKREKGLSKTEWKKSLKELAIKYFPGVKMQTETSDAYLIAMYCKIIND